MAKKDNSADALVRRRRRGRRQLIGFILSVLAVVGVTTLVTQGIRLTQKLFDDSEEKAAYEKRLTYIVMMDMMPFDSLEQANQTDLLGAACGLPCIPRIAAPSRKTRRVRYCCPAR